MKLAMRTVVKPPEENYTTEIIRKLLVDKNSPRDQEMYKLEWESMMTDLRTNFSLGSNACKMRGTTTAGQLLALICNGLSHDAEKVFQLKEQVVDGPLFAGPTTCQCVDVTGRDRDVTVFPL